MPGTDGLSLLATSPCGIAGALIGGMLADQVFNTGGALQLVLSVVGAAVLIALVSGGSPRDRVIE